MSNNGSKEEIHSIKLYMLERRKKNERKTSRVKIVENTKTKQTKKKKKRTKEGNTERDYYDDKLTAKKKNEYFTSESNSLKGSNIRGWS